MPNINEWYYSLLKGRIAAHVARGHDKPNAVIASIRTIFAKGHISLEAVQRMLKEVQYETVQPFLGPPWHRPERVERFEVIRDGLNAGLAGHSSYPIA